MKKIFIVIVIIFSLAFLSLGYFLGSFKDDQKIKISQRDVDKEACFKEFEEDLRRMGSFKEEAYELSGRVEKVSGNKVHIKADRFSPFQSAELEERIAVIGGGSEIVFLKDYQASEDDKEELARLELKLKELSASLNNCLRGGSDESCPDIKKEQEELIEKIIPLEEMVNQGVKRETIGVSQIKQGMFIKVFPQKGVNIVDIKEFEIIGAQLQEKDF